MLPEVRNGHIRVVIRVHSLEGIHIERAKEVKIVTTFLALIHHVHIAIIHLVYPPKLCITIVSRARLSKLG